MAQHHSARGFNAAHSSFVCARACALAGTLLSSERGLASAPFWCRSTCPALDCAQSCGGTRRPLGTGNSPLKPLSGGSGGERHGPTAGLLLFQGLPTSLKRGSSKGARHRPLTVGRDDDATAHPGGRASKKRSAETSPPPVFPGGYPEGSVPCGQCCRPRCPRALPPVPPLSFHAARRRRVR